MSAYDTRNYFQTILCCRMTACDLKEI